MQYPKNCQLELVKLFIIYIYLFLNLYHFIYHSSLERYIHTPEL